MASRDERLEQLKNLHKQKIAEDMQMRCQANLQNEDHPLESPVRKGHFVRPQLEEELNGLAIGVESSPEDRKRDELARQRAFHAALSSDAEKATSIKNLMKDEAFAYRDRKPFQRKVYDGSDIDPSAKITSFGANESRLAAESKAKARADMILSQEESKLRSEKKEEEQEKIISCGLLSIGEKGGNNDRKSRFEAQRIYKESLDADISQRNMVLSENMGVSIVLGGEFNIGGAARDDSPSQEDRRRKIENQKSYRRELDAQKLKSKVAQDDDIVEARSLPYQKLY